MSSLIAPITGTGLCDAPLHDWLWHRRLRVERCAPPAWRLRCPLPPITPGCDCVRESVCGCTPPCYTNLFCCVDIVDICPTLLAAPAGDAISDRVTLACTGWSEFRRVPDNIGAAVAAARRRTADSTDAAARDDAPTDQTNREAADSERPMQRVDVWV